jgi:SAM-dependent methyltransferase
MDIQENTQNEVKFLTKVLDLKRGKRLLDVACGYGRHLIPLTKKGVDVYGCDLSADMLSFAGKALKSSNYAVKRLVQCDMRMLPFNMTFDCACNMFNSFGYFDGEQDNYRVLVSIKNILKPGGLFLLDLVNRDYMLRTLLHKDWYEKKEAVILEKKDFDSVNNRSEIDVTVIDKNGKRNYHHSIRVYSFTEISMLLEAAGFRVLDVFGGFDFEEYNLYNSRMLVLSELSRE